MEIEILGIDLATPGADQHSMATMSCDSPRWPSWNWPSIC